MTNSQYILPNIFTDTEHTAFLSNLAVNKIIDIAKIVILVDESRAAIVELVDGTYRRFRAEVLTIGNGVCTAQSGQYCLLFVPRTAYNMTEAGLDTSASYYDKRYMKCLPISLPNNNDVRFTLGDTALNVTSDEYNLSMMKDLIQFLSPTLNLSVNTTAGTTTLTTENGENRFIVGSEGIEQQYGNVYDEQTGEVKTSASIIKTSKDGSIDLQTQQDEDGNIKSQISIDVEGNISVKSLNEGNVNALLELKNDGTISLQSSADGELKASIGLNPDGTLAITTTDKYSIAGAAGVEIDGQDGKVSIKNNQYSLADAFNDLITALDKFATQGSPAAHTAVPGQFTQLQQKLANFLE